MGGARGERLDGRGLGLLSAFIFILLLLGRGAACRRGGRGGGAAGAGGRSGCGGGRGLRDEGPVNLVRGSAGSQVHALGAAPRLALLVGGAVVSGVARVCGRLAESQGLQLQERHTARLVRAANLPSGRVEAVNCVIARGASLVAGTAGLGARGSGVAGSLLRLVARVVLAADDAKHVAHRHLHVAGLVGRGLGGDTGGEGQGRESGDGLDEHGDGWWVEICQSSRSMFNRVSGGQSVDENVVVGIIRALGYVENEWIERKTLG